MRKYPVVMIVGGDETPEAKRAANEAARNYCNRIGVHYEQNMSAEQKRTLSNTRSTAARQVHLAGLTDCTALIGRAGTHKFRITPHPFLSRAMDAEAVLAAAGIPLKARQGAIVRIVSGEPVAKAYKYDRTGQIAVLVRTSKDWRLESLTDCQLSPREGGTMDISLVAHQRDLVVKAALAPFGTVAS